MRVKLYDFGIKNDGAINSSSGFDNERVAF